MKRSRASITVFGLTANGFFSLRSRRGIAKFLTVLASTFSNVDGSDVALKPRRITNIALAGATIATSSSRRRKFFQRFIAVSIRLLAGDTRKHYSNHEPQ